MRQYIDLVAHAKKWPVFGQSYIQNYVRGIMK